MRTSRNRIVLGLLQLAIGLSLYACSDDSSDGGLSGAGGSQATGGSGKGGASGTSTTTGGTSSGGNTTAGTSSSGGTGNVGTIPVEACNGLPFDSSAGAGGATSAGGAGGAEACTGVSYEAEHVDVDLFIMMDRSSSMAYLLEGTGMTRWEAVKAAVQEFVQSPDAVGIEAGIGFFSKSGIGDDALDCDPANYAEPAVAIGPLADVGADLVAAIDGTPPAGLTPTLPALEGAITYARGWAADHPDHATAVVLVTDGYPTQCGGNPEEVAAAAQDGYNVAPYIKTYVIGVGDVARFNLDNYAREGGTRDAYLTDQADVSATFVEALNNITSSDIACEYHIPTPADPGMQIDYDAVQVVYTPQGGDPEEVPSIDALGSCAKNDNGGWYYDNPEDPTTISVCPCTCSRFGAGRVDVRLGCKPRIGLR